MKGELSIGIAGLGPIVQLGYLPALISSAEFDLKALCSPSRERLRVMGGRFGVENTYTNWQDMLDAGGLDAVLLTEDYRQDVLEEALKRGIHVLTSGPLCPTSQQAGFIRETVDAKGLVVQLAHLRRYDASFEKAQRIIQEVLNEDDARVMMLTEIRAPSSVEPSSIIPAEDLVPGWAEKNIAHIDHALEEVIGRNATTPIRKAWTTIQDASGCISVLRGLIGKPREIRHVSMSPAGTFIVANLMFPGELMVVLTIGRGNRLRLEEHLELHGQQSHISYHPPDPLVSMADGMITKRSFETGEEVIRSYRVGPCRAVKGLLSSFAKNIHEGITPTTGVHTAVEEMEIMEAIMQKLLPASK